MIPFLFYPNDDESGHKRNAKPPFFFFHQDLEFQFITAPPNKFEPTTSITIRPLHPEKQQPRVFNL
jgi:hypothetical protein